MGLSSCCVNTDVHFFSLLYTLNENFKKPPATYLVLLKVLLDPFVVKQFCRVSTTVSSFKIR